MIGTNLATRPFYNQRRVSLWIGVLALLVLSATVWNVMWVLRFSGSSTELATQAASDERRASDARREANLLRSGIDARQIQAASADARQANDLIDRRTFSWTELFNRFETTLPDNARIASVVPRLDRERRITLTVVVLARSVDDVDQFMERLDATGSFRQLRSTQERSTDEGQIESVLEAQYLPASPAAPSEATP